MKSLVELQSFVQKATRKSFDENGRLTSLVYVHDKQFGVTAFDFKHREKEPEMRQTIVRFIHALRTKGLFEGATLSAEAWVSSYASQEAAKNAPLPEHDPKRREVILAGAWDAQGNKSMAKAPIKRDGDKATVGEWELWPDKFDMWIDRAFVDPEKILKGK